jgi:diacylglycerol O-acyltransferase
MWSTQPRDIVGRTMSLTRLSPLDATFLHVEDDVSHMNIGSVGIFEGPPPEHALLLATIEGKLHLAPRYRQRVRFIPAQAGRPVWVDDPHFELDYHVRRTALPAPGGDEQLHLLVGRVMSHQLDRARPLWEMWVVEGLADGRWALISKLHHAMVDGISASNLVTAIMDTRRDVPASEPVPWRPAPAPAGPVLVAQALAERARWPLREARAAAGWARDPAGVVGHAARTLQGLAAYAGIVRPPAASALNGPIGPHRRWDHARARLSDVKEVKSVFGGTVNDVVLAVITAGFRDLLGERGETTDRTVRSLVPVSVRTRGESGVYDNKVSAIFAALPVAIADPVERLRSVSSQMAHLKATHEAEAGEVLTSVAGFAPEILLSLSGRLATRTPQHNVATVTTNVPGPQFPLYLAGRRMLETYPYVPLGGHVRVGVAIYSYDGQLGFGVTGDYDTARDIAVLCAGIERGTAELLALARGTEPAPAPRRTTSRTSA